MIHITYSGNPLDRRAVLRPNEAELRAIFKGGAARIVPVWNMKHAFTATPRAQVLSISMLAAKVNLDTLEPVFLGFSDDVPWFALSLPGADTPPDFGEPAEYRALNEVVTLLPGTEASILAYARAMVIWHDTHRYCGKCGATAKPAEGGHARVCTNDACNHRTFPRTDPAVITLIENGARTHCLLGRQARWPAGMYSVIAGFVEPGESLEETVIRETFEETGVRVTDVRYLASQPWPFPSSIMLGFRARAVSDAISRTDDELEDARWFTRNDLRSFGKPGPYEALRLPNPFSIARFLVNTWLDEG
ncbi:MAG: NAD(+) diphosphatase [Rhodospirillaceae bacterium]|nr:NAD(+) diphosphatase [Rhodospirillaceae bacterium]